MVFRDSVPPLGYSDVYPDILFLDDGVYPTIDNIFLPWDWKLWQLAPFSVVPCDKASHRKCTLLRNCTSHVSYKTSDGSLSSCVSCAFRS